MKAIVLTYDINHPLTDHMIQCYGALWPHHPFTFRIPYQGSPDYLQSKFGGKVELIQTPSAIKSTVLTLLDDLDDREWIYWCIDDKFPLKINVDKAIDCHDWLIDTPDQEIDGAMFCRCRRLLEDENLMLEDTRLTPGGVKYIRRRNYYQFWIHQFLRVGVLRGFFSGIPDRNFKAKEMDAFTGQNPGMKVMDFDPGQKIYVSEINYASFGESTHAGRISVLCRDSMLKHAIAVPKEFEVVMRRCVAGRM